jgi:hypothetical protein
MKRFPYVVLFIGVFCVTAVARSLWNEVNIYKPRVNVGDIIRVRFDKETQIRYRIEGRMSRYQESHGKRGEGQAFDFYPEARITDNDDRNFRNTLEVRNNNNFIVPSIVGAVEGNTIVLHGNTSTTIDNQIFALELRGMCNINSIRPDFSVASEDIYNLDFHIKNYSLTDDTFLSGEDLIFETNFTDISTNIVVENEATNYIISTNEEAFTLRFSGIRDEKKRELIIHYLNVLVNSLFR